MFVLAALWDRYDLGRRQWLRGRVIHLGKVPLHTTSLAGGVMFILLGVLFLAFDGTSALPSLMGVDAEFTWEERLSRWAGAIPDRTPLLGLSTVAAVAALAALLRTRPGRREERHPPAEHVHADGTEKEHRCPIQVLGGLLPGSPRRPGSQAATRPKSNPIRAGPAGSAIGAVRGGGSADGGADLQALAGVIAVAGRRRVPKTWLP